MGYGIPPVRLSPAAAAPSSAIPYGVAMLGAEFEWSEVKEKLKEITVAVMDSGRPEHPDLKIAGAFNFTDSPDELDRHGHSTHVCGTIAANGKIFGVAPWVQLYTYKVLNDRGRGEWSWLARAIKHAADSGIDVINMSLGGPDGSPEVEEAVEYAYAKGTILVASAGNESTGGVSYPGAYAKVIATAAVDLEKHRGDFSSIGPQVEVAAAGVDVYSTYLNGSYAVLSGTSMASPHIAGAAAILRAKDLIRFGKRMPVEMTRYVLKLYAEDVGAFGPDPEYGFGVFSFGRFEKPETVRHSVRMFIGKKTYYVDGVQREMDVAPFVKNGRTFVPIRFMAEGLGKIVEWLPPETVEVYDP